MTMMSPRAYRLRDLITTRTGRRGVLPFGRTTLYQMVKDGQFPRPIKLGPKIVAWDAESVDRWWNGYVGKK